MGKTAAFFEKSCGFTYLGLAAALAAWYNIIKKSPSFLRPVLKKTYLIGESAFKSDMGGEQHG